MTWMLIVHLVTQIPTARAWPPPAFMGNDSRTEFILPVRGFKSKSECDEQGANAGRVFERSYHTNWECKEDKT